LRIHYPMVSPYHSYKTYGIDLFPLLWKEAYVKWTVRLLLKKYFS
jgi:hypothetical protein